MDETGEIETGWLAKTSSGKEVIGWLGPMDRFFESSMRRLSRARPSERRARGHSTLMWGQDIDVSKRESLGASPLSQELFSLRSPWLCAYWPVWPG